MLASVPFRKLFLHMSLEIFVHTSFGLAGPLWTTFELKIDLPPSKNEPDVATLTLLNWLKLQKHQNVFAKAPDFFSKTGGYHFFWTSGAELAQQHA